VLEQRSLFSGNRNAMLPPACIDTVIPAPRARCDSSAARPGTAREQHQPTQRTPQPGQHSPRVRRKAPRTDNQWRHRGVNTRLSQRRRYTENLKKLSVGCSSSSLRALCARREMSCCLLFVGSSLIHTLVASKSRAVTAIAYCPGRIVSANEVQRGT
jgi:hypothetical protein